jgi:hypothetical protein
VAGGDGDLLVPRGDVTRAISGYDVEIEDIPDGKRLVGSWPGSAWIGSNVTGTRYMGSRNPVGIRPDGVEQIRSAMYDFVGFLIGGRSGRRAGRPILDSRYPPLRLRGGGCPRVGG